MLFFNFSYKVLWHTILDIVFDMDQLITKLLYFIVGASIGILVELHSFAVCFSHQSSQGAFY
jgi:uncharacterized membrane protein AbrB (regulator of aidB expression)